jgi:outer membrane receptor for ferric coprogen and ferric-rhodotorulic acid
MKSLRLIALGAALALLPHAADAASRHHKDAPSRASVRQPQDGNGSYYVPDVKDAAGNPVPIMQIPGSVVVVPRQVIDDQQDIGVCGALRNVSGVFCR